MEHENRHSVIVFGGGTWFHVIDNITHAVMMRTKSRKAAHRRKDQLNRASAHFAQEAAAKAASANK